MAASVVIADDHVILREGVVSLLDPERFEVVGTAADGREALEVASRRRPNIVLLDVTMPGMDGLAAAREIRKISPESRIILLTQRDDPETVVEAMKLGVAGYVLKCEAAADLVRTMEDAMRGGVNVSSRVLRPVMDTYLKEGRPGGDPLSPREREVLVLIAGGKSTKEAATELGISVKTAESHRSRIMEKLDIHETASLVRYAIRHRYIEA
jgi:DNA-binding NarL/FixJ family response regulator